jgi:hypothetical protein
LNSWFVWYVCESPLVFNCLLTAYWLLYFMVLVWSVGVVLFIMCCFYASLGTQRNKRRDIFVVSSLLRCA